MLRLLWIGLVAFFVFSNAQAFSKWDLHGKVDGGPTYILIDVLESGKTVETMKLGALKADAILQVIGGVCVKPGFIIGTGQDGRIAAFSIGVGHFIPVNDKFMLLPTVGYSFGYLRTKIDLEEFFMFGLKEKFHSESPFVGLEMSYKITEKLCIVGCVQYIWSRTHTKIGKIVSDKSHSEGPNYSIGIDYSLNKNLSLTFGVGYNISLSKEKHGLRARGVRLGLAYYY